MSQLRLLSEGVAVAPRRLSEDTVVLEGFALPEVEALFDALRPVLRAAPLRRMTTPGGRTIGVASTNCGALGWVSDRTGYRYTPRDPLSGQPWPAMPPALCTLAIRAAIAAGYEGFEPDACLINRYKPGVGMSLHQDRNERDFSAPIVSVSLGVSATFLYGGDTRDAKPQRIPLDHGDVMVWGRNDRLRFHGVAPLPGEAHPRTGNARFNLTFRRAL